MDRYDCGERGSWWRFTEEQVKQDRQEPRTSVRVTGTSGYNTEARRKFNESFGLVAGAKVSKTS
jgi:hypothetical protein